MKKLVFIQSLLMVFSFQIHVCYANKIDLLKVVNENIEQYKANAMNQQQNTRSRAIDAKNKQSMANKSIIHKILFHIKNNRNLLLAVATAATSLWGIRFLLKKMPSMNSDASSFDSNNEELFEFEENNLGINYQPNEVIVDEQEKNSTNNDQGDELNDSLNQNDIDTADKEEKSHEDMVLQPDSLQQSAEGEIYPERTESENMIIGIAVGTTLFAFVMPFLDKLLASNPAP